MSTPGGSRNVTQSTPSIFLFRLILFTELRHVRRGTTKERRVAVRSSKTYGRTMKNKGVKENKLSNPQVRPNNYPECFSLFDEHNHPRWTAISEHGLFLISSKMDNQIEVSKLSIFLFSKRYRLTASDRISSLRRPNPSRDKAITRIHNLLVLLFFQRSIFRELLTYHTLPRIFREYVEESRCVEVPYCTN